MAQGVAWAARELGVPCTVIAPDHAPETKVAAIERLGGRVIKVPFGEWWTVIEESRFEGVEGLFLHPVENEDVMAGNGTIGLEILEDLPDPDAIIVPWGGGGLFVGIASAVKAHRPETELFGRRDPPSRATPSKTSSKVPIEPPTSAPHVARSSRSTRSTSDR